MKLIHKTFIALAFCGFVAGVINAQTPIVPHLTDKSIKVEVPEFMNVSPFIRENLIQISSDNVLAYINLKGEYVYGFDLKMKEAMRGVTGKFDCAAAVLSPQDGGSKLEHAILCQQGRMLPLGKLNYSKISDFCDGIVAAVKDDPNNYGKGHYVYLNAAGKEVFPSLHRKIENIFSVNLQISPLREGMRAFYDITLKKWGYADKDGKVIIQPKYGQAMPFSEGLAAVCMQDGDYGAKKWGFIDKTGKEIVACNYKVQPASFSDGLAVLNIGEETWDNKAVFIDKTGQIRSQEYKICNSFFGGFAYVKTQDKQTIVIDKNFNVVKTIDFPIDQLTNDNLRISEKNPFGLEFIDGLAAAGYDDLYPNGTLYTNDGNILFKKDGRNSIYNFYDGKYALCRYKIDGKEIYGFINKKGEFVIYFEKKSDFSYTTPKPQNAGCELCAKTASGNESGANTEIVSEPEPTPPCDICNPKSVCYDEYNCCDENNPKSKCHIPCDVCNPKSKCYNEYECCEECNPKSKCYDEYECCDEKNPKSRCYEPGPCPDFDCNKIIIPMPCDSCDTKQPEFASDTMLNYKMFSAKITLNKVATYLQMGSDINNEKQFTSLERDKDNFQQFTTYNMAATVYMAISDNSVLPTPFDDTAYGLIWIVTESGMPGRPQNDTAVYWSAPYTILSLTKNEIGFGAGLIFGVLRNYEQRSVSAQSSELGKALLSLKKLVSDPFSLFIDDELIEDPEIPQKANYKINADGSMLLTSSTLPIFDNLLLTPYFPDEPVVIYRESLGYVLEHSNTRKTDRENADVVGHAFDKALRQKYFKLKEKFEKK